MNFPSSHLIQFEVYSQKEIMTRYFLTILIISVELPPEAQFKKSIDGRQNIMDGKRTPKYNGRSEQYLQRAKTCPLEVFSSRPYYILAGYCQIYDTDSIFLRVMATLFYKFSIFNDANSSVSWVRRNNNLLTIII